MKFVAAILSVLMVGQVASAEMSKAQGAQVLANALQFTSEGSVERQLLSSILAGQSYENRVSLMESNCATVADADRSTCNFTIGVDNTNDEDSGWSTVYNLKVNSVDGQVVSLKLDAVAG